VRACVRACVRAKGRTYMSGGVHKPYQFQYCARVERLVCIANITKKRHFFCQTICSQYGLAQCSSTAVLQRKEHRATHTIWAADTANYAPVYVLAFLPRASPDPVSQTLWWLRLAPPAPSLSARRQARPASPGTAIVSVSKLKFLHMWTDPSSSSLRTPALHLYSPSHGAFAQADNSAFVIALVRRIG